MPNTRVAASNAINFFRGINWGPGIQRAKALGASLGTDMWNVSKTGGFRFKAGIGAGVGAAAGYAYGGDTSSALKGAGLGVLGAAGHSAYRVGRANPLLAREYAAGKSWLSNNRGNITNWAKAKGRYARSMVARKTGIRDMYYDGMGSQFADSLGLTGGSILGPRNM